MLATVTSAPGLAQDEIFAITQPVELRQNDPENIEVGELIYRGGVVIEPGEEKIGGISGLEWHDGLLYAVSDDGKWLTIEPDEINGRLIDVLTITRGDLNDERGRRLRDKEDADAEAITRDADGNWLVSFERRHRVWRYSNLAEGAGADLEYPPSILFGAQGNSGIETLAQLGDRLLVCGEWAGTDRDNCSIVVDGGEIAFEVTPPPELAEHGGVPTDAACGSDGTCYILFRSYREGQGNRAAIVAMSIEGDTETIASLLPSLTLDNFEGLALREQFGKTFLYLVSDNNFSENQRTLLMKFEIRQTEPLIAATPEPEVNYETTDVVLETEMGDIKIRLETERAPITAANFLRYIDEGRFDGTVFYRAMKLEREPMPNGLIQGGTQFDPERILPGILHEPTTQTGLSHTNGALSMAMGEPGTANGDFSIMLADQVGLDAQPGSNDPIWKNGYAVFGYVIEGMDVVSAIHALPADPDKGEGMMVGQILADPVTILDARRVEEPAE
ncbi:esterase-like activity of phytase family protein [Erythrobacter sp. KY5]|uniref:esterase-like activity of phytase family protein n=1 Tax=Erythrobacter sp. KY5 TaxID=2011159 RepID=UPI0013A6C0D6|nr:esterase-like activity of phytase family protein [Erythrobacter sp. KY5]